ncbi:MAG: UbiA family prenyltransferase [Promethearchaeota archaeon]|jgi:hypothetical protein
MSKGFKLLRVEYLFSVLIPCLLAIYLNKYDINQHLWILAGFAFYGITGNTLNDYIDMRDPNEKETLERVEGYHRKEILILAMGSFVLGTASFMKSIVINPLLAIYLVIIIFMVIFYILFKSLVIINHIILGVSHIVLPWFMIKINARDIIFNYFPAMSLSESLILIMIISLAYCGQMVHELIDGDSLSKLKPRTAQLVIWIASIITLIVSIISFVITLKLEFLPIVLFPLGIMYIFRTPRTNLARKTSLKDTGIILGNFMLAYVIVLIMAS